MECAREEFFAKGYTKASLRKICADAGVTTGALYFFFKDKAELFSEIVSPPYYELIDLISKYFAKSEYEVISADVRSLPSINFRPISSKFGDELIRLLYDNNKEFLILINGSEGSEFSDCVERFVELMERCYRSFAEKMCLRLHNGQINDYVLHWLAHQSVSSIIHLLTHPADRESAKHNVEIIINCITGNRIHAAVEVSGGFERKIQYGGKDQKQ